ncbi:MAG: helix-hairpin-helix domain-containing protein [Solirubrobacterales bacterium]|nr:helix-hairpin-helix domain-containing protein [Solirubrobacterales bacterium]
MGTVKDVEMRRGWRYFSLIPVLGTVVPLYAGMKAGRRGWMLLGVLWMVMAVLGIVLASLHLGWLISLSWVGAVVTSASVGGPGQPQLSPPPRLPGYTPLDEARHAAEIRLHDRERARRLAREHPELALEMGIGRPDVPGAHSAGLVDVNNASAAALAQLPLVDDDLATWIVQTRARVHGFESVEDLGAALNLDGEIVEALRGPAVFLPRRAN